MKKIRRRLFMHFSIQFISIAILMIIVAFITLIVAVGLMTEEQAEHNYYYTKLEDITMDTYSFKDLTMNKGWDEGLAEENIWVQIINEQGEVIESGNVPSDFPEQYSMHDLLTMKETKEYKGFSLAFYLETFYVTDYLFVLGYEAEGAILLDELVQTYNQNGGIAKQDVPEMNNKLQQVGGKLDIYDSNGEQRMSIGEENRERELPLDVFKREISPDTYSMEQHVYRDAETGNVWILYTPNINKGEIRFRTYQATLIGLVITGAIVLLVTIVISVWNGFRYGNPLLIFANWLSRMGNGKYEEVLTERERKQIFRKNGKTKWRYRLYREVFYAFYDMAEKLDASKKEREQLEKTREEWMAGISHDLRTPLTTMEGYGRLLESGEYNWSKQELEDIGKTIHEKSDYMVKLIEDFTLSFQLKNNAALVSFQPVEMNAFIEKILKKFTNDITFQDYTISCEPLGTERVVNINERLFERMIDNLIYNALKHNPSGTSVIIRIEETKDDRELKISVIDNGFGMDEETKENLFSRYYRGTNTEDNKEGTGLGMSIALQIAKLHQGSIFVESEKTVGTSISVVL
ncbi:sensor histidine kinase [Oceanobacillus piezotolerans]|uniref:histidine kinase n=1 Tax=Oceanobacillus piezotolerans TaxID=2448030 RepID=A0A498D805_9BACI|nr:HAMP domain-containing sensor histidine kinase [Oceanobacillus piezotolerans]RLL42673.1 sensor histidine kinase [Oceanobacillus piezotolerans]